MQSRIAAVHGQFNRIRQVASMWPPHLVHCNRYYLHHTGAAPCWVALSISTADADADVTIERSKSASLWPHGSTCSDCCPDTFKGCRLTPQAAEFRCQWQRFCWTATDSAVMMLSQTILCALSINISDRWHSFQDNITSSTYSTACVLQFDYNS